MDLKTVRTEDGSLTLFVPGLREHYHSTYGAVQESRHVFLNAGLKRLIPSKEISVFEVGFGTGLNAFLTMAEAERCGQKIFYCSVESAPLEENYYLPLNYPEVAGVPGYRDLFFRLHTAMWDQPVQITPHFTLLKIHCDLIGMKHGSNRFDLIYFDAFGPEVQPELWKESIFTEMFKILNPGGILVTFSAKGEVRRGMRKAGFAIEKLPGPKGKREMTRALKCPQDEIPAYAGDRDG